MAILKKIKASTLIETLVATVIIVLIFILASMILNNLFSNTIKNETRTITNHLNELKYLQSHNKLQLPYGETFQDWNITIDKYQDFNLNLIEFEAVNLKTNKTISISQSENQ